MRGVSIVTTAAAAANRAYAAAMDARRRRWRGDSQRSLKRTTPVLASVSVSSAICEQKIKTYLLPRRWCSGSLSRLMSQCRRHKHWRRCFGDERSRKRCAGSNDYCYCDFLYLITSPFVASATMTDELNVLVLVLIDVGDSCC